MSDPITLVRWRDAKTDPPKEERFVWTDVGDLAHFDGLWYDHDRWLLAHDPQPAVWCDPVPPGDGPLTVEDLRLALAWAEGAHNRHEERRPRHFNPHIEPEMQEAAQRKSEAFARLRRAIENLGAQDE